MSAEIDSSSTRSRRYPTLMLIGAPVMLAG